jgi:hypothetical protein
LVKWRNNDLAEDITATCGRGILSVTYAQAQPAGGGKIKKRTALQSQNSTSHCFSIFPQFSIAIDPLKPSIHIPFVANLKGLRSALQGAMNNPKNDTDVFLMDATKIVVTQDAGPSLAW